MSVTGYKVFNPDWTCMGKAYTCPGTFEEDVNPTVCKIGMHFCKKAADCFNYYSFDSRNHVAEVRAYGTIIENDDKCCTNKLEIVREIPWTELFELVNTGKNNTGLNNSGDRNSGDWNSGDWNSGNGNSGDWNSCNHSSGCFNVKSNKIYFFDKPSNWTYQDWFSSVAKLTMDCVPSNLVWVEFAQMTDDEKEAYPTAKTTGGYLREIPDPELAVIRNEWWARLSPDAKDKILKLPNFDGEIFKEITMIDVSNAAE